MGKRKKRLIKQIEGLEKQKEIHKCKLENEHGRMDTTPEYWEKEIEIFERIKKEKLEKLRKLESRKIKN
jgi:hypothetical protein